MSKIVPQLQKYIATRDARYNKQYEWFGSDLLNAFTTLVEEGAVTFGGRASCGGKVDPSWVRFSMFNEIVAKAKRMGYGITVSSIKQKNRYASDSGGFWHENEYVFTGEAPHV
jgi:hypothetical protein